MNTAQKPPKLTADTMVPISIFGVVAGAVFWLSTMYTQVVNARQQINEIKQSVSELNEQRRQEIKTFWQHQIAIDQRLTKIEAKIDFMVGKLK